MNKQILGNLSLVVVLLFSAACNLGAGGRAQPNTAETNTEPLPITDYTLFYQQKVASGEWTREKGLVTLLKLFAGETTEQQVGMPSTITEFEETGILIQAGQYLDHGKDATTKAELKRLLQLLAPSQAKLDAYSIPAQATENKPAGLAAPIKPETTDCAALWVEGFPDARTPAYPCFQYSGQAIGGVNYRVYLPLAWRGDPSRLAFYEATVQAISDTVPLYSRYGAMRSIYFVFSLLPNPHSATAHASVIPAGWQPGEEACPIMIYPNGVTVDIPVFKQIIAHEMFHCFQIWNLHDQMFGPTDSAGRWWFESTAEYFSNLVYPSTDEEYHFMTRLIDRSASRQMTDMAYENFLFFQYLGNLRRPDGVIAFLGGLPTSGGSDAQLAALAGTPGMDTIYQGFARDFIDNRIADSSGSIYPYTVTFLPANATAGASTIPYQSFTILRYQYTFPQGNRYTTTFTFPDSLTTASAEPNDATAAWGNFPYNFDQPCSDQTYKLAIVSSVGDSGHYTFRMNVATAASPCNNCLTGLWNLDNTSYGPFFRMTYANVSAPVPTLNSVTGRLYLQFNGDGTLSGGYEHFTIDYTPQVPGMNTASLETKLVLDGIGTGNYSAPNTPDTILSLSHSDFNITTQIFMNGVAVGDPTGISTGMTSMPIANQERMSCTGNKLMTFFPITGGTTYPPLTWNRAGP
jgi:hypothetical protein